MTGNLNQVTTHSIPALVPSVYYGNGHANTPPTLLSLPLDVLNLIAQELARQHAAFPLRFVCKRLASLKIVKEGQIRCDGRSRNDLLRYLAADAIRLGAISLFEWYHRHLRRPLTVTSTQLAAKSGHLALLQWLREKNCPWDERTSAKATQGGHLAVLQWARANGCPWDLYTCRYAAAEGHLEVLQWARAKGCPWNPTVWNWAAPNVKSWLIENGCPGTSEPTHRG